MSDVQNRIVREAIALSGAGYGNYTIVAEKDEKTTILKSEDQILRTTVLASDSPSDMVENLSKRLRELRRGEQ